LHTIVLIGSIIGIVNSFILILYALISKKGNRKVNFIFALLILVLTLRVVKSIIITFWVDVSGIIQMLGLFIAPAIGPTYMFFTEAVLNTKFNFKLKQLLHFIPLIIFTLLWVNIEVIRNGGIFWYIFYQTILLQYMIYLTIAIYKAFVNVKNKPLLVKQLNIISCFLLAIWFAYFLNAVSDFPYIMGAVIYSILIYFSLIIIINRGYIINFSQRKYHNTGLNIKENQRILQDLNSLFEKEKIYKDNTLGLTKLAKILRTNTHALSQVINENKNQTFFELIRYYRIEEAKRLLLKSSDTKILEIAFDVGYNSLSTFNSVFKKATGLTPTKFRNEKINS